MHMVERVRREGGGSFVWTEGSGAPKWRKNKACWTLSHHLCSMWSSRRWSVLRLATPTSESREQDDDGVAPECSLDYFAGCMGRGHLTCKLEKGRKQEERQAWLMDAPTKVTSFSLLSLDGLFTLPWDPCSQGQNLFMS